MGAVVTAWVLSMVVFCVLYVFWQILSLTFDMIDRAQREEWLPPLPDPRSHEGEHAEGPVI